MSAWYIHSGWNASAVCFPINFFIQWPRSLPENNLLFVIWIFSYNVPGPVICNLWFEICDFQFVYTISQFLGWEQFVICIFLLLIQWPRYLPVNYLISNHIVLTYRCMMCCHIVHNCTISLMLYIFVHIEVSYRGSFAQRGPTYRGGPPRVDNRERGSAATWKSPCPPPVTSDVIVSDFQLVFLPIFVMLSDLGLSYCLSSE